MINDPNCKIDKISHLPNRSDVDQDFGKNIPTGYTGFARLFQSAQATSTLGSLLALAWFAFLGEWLVTLFGFLGLFLSPLAIMALLLPGFVFTVPASRALENGNSNLAMNLNFIGIIYARLMAMSWSLAVFWLCWHVLSEKGRIPSLMLSVGFTTLPYTFLTKLSKRSDPISISSVEETVFVYCASLVCAGSMLFRDMWFPFCAAIFGTAMLISIFRVYGRMSHARSIRNLQRK